MSLLANIFGGGLGNLVKDIVGSFKLSPAAQKEFEDKCFEREHELQKLEFELESKAMDQTQAIVDAQKSIIVAEMAQGDAYTKRARPTIVYAGLLFIFMNHVFLPMWAFFGGDPMPQMKLPAEFWAAWAGVVGIWSFGRSMERRGTATKIASRITGSNQPTDLNLLTMMRK